MNYLYDESYDGFLTCVYHHWYTGKAEGIFPEREYQLDLCRFAITVETDAEKAARVDAAITEKISKWDAQRVYQTFCSNEPEKEMKLLRYIAFGFKRGSGIRLMHGDPIVKAVEAAEQRVGFEVHRLTGLVRFSEVQGFYNHPAGEQTLLYAQIEPDNDVLEFLAPHFSDRFKSEPFIIHDLKRGKALFAYERKWRIGILSAEVAEKAPAGRRRRLPLRKGDDKHEERFAESDCDEGGMTIHYSNDEEGYRALWKNYCEVMATKERINPRCQRQFMPVRYHKHLPEIG